MRPDTGDGEASAQHHGSKLSCRLITEHATSVSQATLVPPPRAEPGTGSRRLRAGGAGRRTKTQKPDTPASWFCLACDLRMVPRDECLHLSPWYEH